MSNELFGSIVYDGKMINLDKEDLEKLKNMSIELKNEQKNLIEKISPVFNQ